MINTEWYEYLYLYMSSPAEHPRMDANHPRFPLPIPAAGLFSYGIQQNVKTDQHLLFNFC